MSLGQYRPVERVQPGWLVITTPPGAHMNDDSDLTDWCEVRAIFDFRSGTRRFHFTDGSKAIAHPGDELRCITLAEKAQRREALGESA